MKVLPSMTIKQFEIWVANLDPRQGTETGKIRPILIVQTDLLTHVTQKLSPFRDKIFIEYNMS